MCGSVFIIEGYLNERAFQSNGDSKQRQLLKKPKENYQVLYLRLNIENLSEY